MKRRIIIFGAGIVGQAAGKSFAKKGYEVTFVDINPIVIDKLRREGYNAYLTSELNGVTADVTMFHVSTPPNHDGSVNLDNLRSAVVNHAYWLKRHASGYHLVVIRSTVPPGTTRKMIALFAKLSGLRIGVDFGVCMQPEFLRARSSEEDFLHPWATVIGELDNRSGDVLEELYKGWSDNIYRTDLETAEFMKYVHNCYNALKISFTNEMWLLGKQLGIDTNKALHLASKTAEGSWNPDYGITGGRPYGGTCLPKDTKGFLSYARKLGINLPLLSAVDSVNSLMEDLSHQKIAAPSISNGFDWVLWQMLEKQGVREPLQR